MSLGYSGYGPRQPRHEVSAAAGFPVVVEQPAGETTGPLKADLVNLSRTGFQLRASVRLAKGESIIVKLDDEKSGLGLTLAGTVRWTRAKDDGTWLYGCLLGSQIEWETLGELFLRGILASDGP